MQRMAALVGALLMTLVVAAPAAANQRVLMAPFTGPYDFETPVSIADGWDFECSGQIYYGGYGTNSLWLWYANGVDEADMMPEGRAWPWIKGQYDAQGVDYFSSLPDMGGLVASGKYKTTTHQYDHHLGTPGDPADLETWTPDHDRQELGHPAPRLWDRVPRVGQPQVQGDRHRPGSRSIRSDRDRGSAPLARQLDVRHGAALRLLRLRRRLPLATSCHLLGVRRPVPRGRASSRWGSGRPLVASSGCQGGSPSRGAFAGAARR